MSPNDLDLKTSAPAWRPNPAQKQRVLGFLGYGAPLPRIVFVGLEEFCPADSQWSNLRVRCESDVFRHARCDRDEATIALFGEEAASSLLRPHAVPVWSAMSCIMSALFRRDSDSEYRSLGRSTSTTLLTELLPLPRPNVDEWDQTYIPACFDYDSFSSYRREVLAARIDRLRTELATAKPAVVFCYGTSERKAFTQLFETDQLAWKAVDADIHVTTWRESTVVLTPFYGRLSARSRGALFAFCERLGTAKDSRTESRKA